MTDHTQSRCVGVGAAYTAGEGRRYQEHAIKTPLHPGAATLLTDWFTYPVGQSCGRPGCKNAEPDR